MADKEVTILIDGTELTVPESTTIMQAAEKLGVYIPRLCYLPGLSLQGSCRVCIVAVEGVPFYMASCSVAVWEGMNVRANSPEIRQARRDIIELLLDNHPRDCQTCERDGHCELQNLAYSHGIRERLFEGRRKQFRFENSSRSVVRDSEKCVLCGRCVRVCAEVQGVYNLDQQGRGFDTVVTPAHMADMDDSVCIQCGQCVAVCPTAAFLQQKHAEEVFAALADPGKRVLVQTAPSIQAAIGEGFDVDPGTPATGRMITALRRLGFETVFNTDLGADLTIVEESNELIHRLDNGGPLPMFTSCSPGWINFLEKFYPALIPWASTCRSPMMMLSVLMKTYYAEKEGIDPHDIYSVAVMPCTAKKYEIRRPEHYLDEHTPYTDAVITTYELIWMLKSYGIDFSGLPDGEFDAPLGLSSGAGDIFGITGGVMEATLRTAAETLTGSPDVRLEFQEARGVTGFREAEAGMDRQHLGVRGLREAEVNLDGRTLRVAVADGLQNAKVVLDRVLEKQSDYHIVEVMACPGGCSGGGGQPYPSPKYFPLDARLLEARGRALYSLDSGKKLRRSHHNPAIKQLYDEYFDKVGSEKSHQLLHTSYRPQNPRGVRRIP